ncbi:OLC1v1007085C1 [Oldenlandia corymbosa var. corymbosa]|uniref:OLC1v1007085C1 n=1 Tax=Oldenlandia corymbosa var. corymbosa TaxID=529605 RepID=A0AAV1DLI7_OLDCO|nr:OLC1v1007085C1 [Oldenlandia corymbosa var. corymbosa]
MANGTGSPCGACKFLRRKCAADCIFAPYFCSEQGPARFAAIHKVFGASNVSKLLLHVPVPDRCEAVVTIAYEAQARLKDPVYGCVSHIFALQQQVAYLQAQLIQAKAQLAQSMIESSRNNAENQPCWPNAGGNNNPNGMMASLIPPLHPAAAYNANSFSPQSSVCSLDSIGAGTGPNTGDIGIGMQEFMRDRDQEMISFQAYTKKRPSQTDLSELQALAFRMMKD